MKDEFLCKFDYGHTKILRHNLFLCDLLLSTSRGKKEAYRVPTNSTRIIFFDIAVVSSQRSSYSYPHDEQRRAFHAWDDDERLLPTTTYELRTKKCLGCLSLFCFQR